MMMRTILPITRYRPPLHRGSSALGFLLQRFIRLQRVERPACALRQGRASHCAIRQGRALYADVVSRTLDAVASASGNVLKGVLWMQGETDGGNGTSVKAYTLAVTTLISDLRSDLGASTLPFIIGELIFAFWPTTQCDLRRTWPPSKQPFFQHCRLSRAPRTAPGSWHR